MPRRISCTANFTHNAGEAQEEHDRNGDAAEAKYLPLKDWRETMFNAAHAELRHSWSIGQSRPRSS